MTRVRLLLAYEGTPFHGFAKQDDVPTVAGELNATLEKLLSHEVETVCAGRTDAGVHGWGQVVHFDTNRSPEELAVMSFHDRLAREDDPRFGTSEMFRGAQLLPGLMRALNKLMAPYVVIREATVAPDNFHARYSAKSRTYRYKILNRETPDPFLARTSWHIEMPLEIAAMRLACDPLMGEQDFAAFTKRQPLKPDAPTKRYVMSTEWEDLGHGLLMFEITANAFTHQMVRSIVGTLVEMGNGKKKAGEMAGILRSKNRKEAGVVAPPQGLCLWNVAY